MFYTFSDFFNSWVGCTTIVGYAVGKFYSMTMRSPPEETLFTNSNFPNAPLNISTVTIRLARPEFWIKPLDFLERIVENVNSLKVKTYDVLVFKHRLNYPSN